MKIVNAKEIKVFINGVEIGGFGDTDFVQYRSHRFVPYDSVTQTERRRMEADARLRAEERLRSWRRNG